MNLNIHIILSHAECGARIKKCSHKKLSLETSRHSHSCYFWGGVSVGAVGTIAPTVSEEIPIGA